MDLHMKNYGNVDLPPKERKNYRKICYFLGVMLNAKGERFVDEQRFAGSQHRECLLEVRAAVGYAFNRDLETGWDVRDTTRVAAFSDEPFFFIRGTLRF